MVVVQVVVIQLEHILVTVAVMVVVEDKLLEMVLVVALVVILALAVMQGTEMVALDNPVLVAVVVAVLI